MFRVEGSFMSVRAGIRGDAKHICVRGSRLFGCSQGLVKPWGRKLQPTSLVAEFINFRLFGIMKPPLKLTV